MASLIEQQSDDFHVINFDSAKSDIHWLRRQHLSSVADSVKSRLDSLLQRIVDLNSIKCSSLWLTALPIKEQGFYLNKQEFCDALSLRFGWQLYGVPSHCVCGSSFSVDHDIICKHEGLTFLRHNELCDLTADWLKEVYHNVAVQPPLLSLDGEAIALTSATRVMKPVLTFMQLGSGVGGRVYFST